MSESCLCPQTLTKGSGWYEGKKVSVWLLWPSWHTVSKQAFVKCSLYALQVQVIKTFKCAIKFSTEIRLKLVHNKCTKLQHDTIQIKASDDEFKVKRGDCGQGYVTGRIFWVHISWTWSQKTCIAVSTLVCILAWPNPRYCCSDRNRWNNMQEVIDRSEQWFKRQNTDYCRYGINSSWGQCGGSICHYSYNATVLYNYQTSQNCLVNLLPNSIYYSTSLHTGGTEISGTACEILWSQEILYLWRNTRFDPVKREVSLTSRDTQCTRPVNHLTSTWTNTMM